MRCLHTVAGPHLHTYPDAILFSAFTDELEKISKVVPRHKLSPPLEVPLQRGDITEFKTREAEAKPGPGDGCSLGRDHDGYYAYTHRARTKSYERPGLIPLDKIRFVGSTS